MMHWIWLFIPERIRIGLMTGLFVVESRGADPAKGLRSLFKVQDKLQWVINERALAYGKGIHPKHRLMRYHDFFVERIEAGSHVLDIGCGYGAVARSIATQVPNSVVVGIEMDRGRLAQARAGTPLDNLSFVEADARTNLPSGSWDVVVLSNILEHIDDRVGFLSDILRQANPVKVLTRVPMFERDWQIPLRKELGANYFSDAEHFIEHRVDELKDELEKVNLRPVEMILLWGEIWADCRPKGRD
jgi:SAM-dependent methyltransferase